VTPSLNLLEREVCSIRLESRAMDVLVALANRKSEVVSIDELIATTKSWPVSSAALRGIAQGRSLSAR
jgi:DNA-binding winged helix-turn-helix (wHTH) protein